MSATLDNGQYVPLVHMVAASCGETVKYHGLKMLYKYNVDGFWGG
jgi:glutathione peroxidase-family protein